MCDSRDPRDLVKWLARYVAAGESLTTRVKRSVDFVVHGRGFMQEGLENTSEVAARLARRLGRSPGVQEALRFFVGIVLRVGATHVRTAAMAFRPPASTRHRSAVPRRRDSAWPLADGTLVASRDVPDADHIPSMLALSDVMGTGWFAADAANVNAGSTVVVVGDGAVGLLGVLSAKQMGAERIIAMSRHEARQKLARQFGATDIVTERGDEGVDRINQLTNGVGADSVLECVGTQESMMQAIKSTRPGGSVGYVGVPHGVTLDGAELFFRHVRLLGGRTALLARRQPPRLQH